MNLQYKESQTSEFCKIKMTNMKVWHANNKKGKLLHLLFVTYFHISFITFTITYSGIQIKKGSVRSRIF